MSAASEAILLKTAKQSNKYAYTVTVVRSEIMQIVSCLLIILSLEKGLFDVGCAFGLKLSGKESKHESRNQNQRQK